MQHHHSQRKNPASRQAGRVWHALRSGDAVWLETRKGAGDGLLVVAAEYGFGVLPVDTAVLADARLVLSGLRARALGLSPEAEALSLSLGGMEAGLLEKLVFLGGDLPVARMNGAYPASETEQAALSLLKSADLLPAALVVPVTDARAADWPDMEDLLRVPVADAGQFPLWKGEADELRVVGSAQVPLAAGQAVITAFRPSDGGAEHLAVVIGDPFSKEAPLVRVHSSCVTGDILGSLRCDCGSQLDAALAMMERAGGGVLLYMNQEGRGIGIAAKLRAYSLQDKAGMDTLEANEALGFEGDERDFAAAAAMLKTLGIGRIRLLSSNPQKQAGLENYGIVVAGRERLAVASNPHNAHYIRTKILRFGHDS